MSVTPSRRTEAGEVSGDGGGMYFDLDGKPMTMEQRVGLLRRRTAARSVAADGRSSPEDDPTRIGSDEVGDAWVSTVWLGMNHRLGDGPPIIFETMIFGGEHDDWQDRYCTKAQARAGHERVVAALKARRSPDD